MSCSAIPPLELHYSTITKFVAIVGFYKFGYVGGRGGLGFYAKFSQHMTYAILNMNALIFCGLMLKYSKWSSAHDLGAWFELIFSFLGH